MKTLLSHLVDEYKKLPLDSWVDYTQKQKTLPDAIRIAALCANENGKRDPHQRLATKNGYESSLDDKAKGLALRIDDIVKAKNFTELHNIVKSVKIKNLAVLANYDIALRIGMYHEIKKKPEKVYLHAGTRKGAERILGPIKVQQLDKVLLPIELQRLESWEIENFLCINHKKL